MRGLRAVTILPTVSAMTAVESSAVRLGGFPTAPMSGIASRLRDHGEIEQVSIEVEWSSSVLLQQLESGRLDFALLREFPGIGPTGVDIFCREAQAMWPWLRPYVDSQVKKGAERVGLPTDAGKLASKVPEKDLARLSAALVRVARDKKLADALKT